MRRIGKLLREKRSRSKTPRIERLIDSCSLTGKFKRRRIRPLRTWRTRNVIFKWFLIRINKPMTRRKMKKINNLQN